jgi:hypothetical protein
VTLTGLARSLQGNKLVAFTTRQQACCLVVTLLRRASVLCPYNLRLLGQRKAKDQSAGRDDASTTTDNLRRAAAVVLAASLSLFYIMNC